MPYDAEPLPEPLLPLAPHSPMPLKILVVDDHPMMSVALADLLRGLGAKVETLIAHSGAAALQMAALHSDLDLVLLDLGLPDADGFDLLARLRARCPGVPLAVVSGSEREQDMRRALAAGALGFIPKSTPPSKLLPAIRCVLAGEIYLPAVLSAAPAVQPGEHGRSGDEALSGRQLDVLRLICAGKSNKFIAQELALAEKTVKGHVTAIFKALDVVNRTQAALRARERRLFDELR